MRLADMRTHRGNGVISGDGLKLRQDRRQIIRRMFSIDEKPVEIGRRRDFGRDGSALRQPAANCLAPF